MPVDVKYRGWTGVVMALWLMCFVLAPFCSAVQDTVLELGVNNMSPTKWRATFVGAMARFCRDYYTYSKTVGSQVRPFCLCSTDS